mgnify:CR=1 FL=1
MKYRLFFLRIFGRRCSVGVNGIFVCRQSGVGFLKLFRFLCVILISERVYSQVVFAPSGERANI